MAPRTDKRKRLIEAADEMFHIRGYERSSIAQIAEAAEVPPGNVYYYFKTKEELFQAVVAARNARFDAWMKELEVPGKPAESLQIFIASYEDSRKERAKNGCPVGSLCQEFNKFGSDLANEASVGFAPFIAWLEARFKEMGQNGKTARANAMHMMGSLQGAILLAHSFSEPRILKAECRRLSEWVTDMAAAQDAAA